MKTLTVRLPDELVADLEAEGRERQRSTSEVVRDRLRRARPRPSSPATLRAIAGLIGSVTGLPEDLSARKKSWLTRSGYGRKPAR